MRKTAAFTKTASSTCGLNLHFHSISFPAVKDEDSDIDVPEDEGSGSDMEECHPFKPRPARNSFMTGLQQNFDLVLLTPGSSHCNDMSSFYFPRLIVLQHIHHVVFTGPIFSHSSFGPTMKNKTKGEHMETLAV